MKAVAGYHDNNGNYIKANYEKAKALVDLEGALNDPDEDGNTPLIESCGRSNIDIAFLLIREFKHDINDETYFGTTGKPIIK